MSFLEGVEATRDWARLLGIIRLPDFLFFLWQQIVIGICSTISYKAPFILDSFFRKSLLKVWLGPFHEAIAVPSVTRCHCRRRCCCCGHRFYIDIHQASLLSHAACAARRLRYSYAGGVRRDTSDTWWMVMRRAAARCGPTFFKCFLFWKWFAHIFYFVKMTFASDKLLKVDGSN